MYWIISIAIGMFFVLCYIMMKSPIGYEDDTGFHYGYPPKDSD